MQLQHLAVNYCYKDLTLGVCEGLGYASGYSKTKTKKGIFTPSVFGHHFISLFHIVLQFSSK